jgi:hypothetical protein
MVTRKKWYYCYGTRTRGIQRYCRDKVPHAEKLYGSFLWKDLLKKVDNFREVSVVKPGVGNTFLFGEDKWVLSDVVHPLKC